MSLFGTAFPMATTQQQQQPSAFSTTTNLFGTPSSTMAAAQSTQPNIFGGAFSSPFSSASLAFSTPSAASIAILQQQPASQGLTFAGFGQQQQSQPQQQSFAIPAPIALAAPSTIGLGGARQDVTAAGSSLLSGALVAGAPSQTGDKGQKDMEVPAELVAIVEALKAKIKENRNISEEIASADPKSLDQLDIVYRSACADYGKAVNAVKKTVRDVKALKDESRQDLLDGEMAQRLKECAAMNFDYAAPLNFLLRRAAYYEKLIEAYAEELHHLEKLMIGHRKPLTSEDITGHLKRVDSAFRYVSTKVYELDKKVQDVKEAFKNYRRSTYGDVARFFPSKPQQSPQQHHRIEGPSPFSITSHNAMLVMANALSRAQSGAGLAPNVGLPSVRQPFGGTQPLSLGFGAPLASQQPQPFSTPQSSLFRPFGAATTTATSATPFASGALSFTTGLSSTAATTQTTTTTASPWRFSSPFNTSSSGTLFGGSATNVGAVKPLGLATPLQQVVSTPANAASSLQLLNPPLGSKRGKS